MVTGRQIGGYQILEELGRGAMGVVFKARQLSMDRIVAIKFLPKKLAQDERIVARFLREARAAGQLAHPNIVSVHELGIAEGLHFIAMEYVDGNSIQKRLKEKGAFSEKETLEISLQIAEALKLAHSRGILHRDIKPDNFLIDMGGRVRLADLGLALIQSNSDAGLTQDGTTLGTPHFMSPEQCSGTGVDARSDLYSLGASMFVMACGRTPYEGNTAAAVMVKVLTEQPLSLKKLRPELTSGFVLLVEKMMSKDPAKRFQDAQSAVEALQLCKTGNYKAVTSQKPLSPVKGATPAKALAGKTQGNSTLPSNNTAGGAEKPGTRPIRPQDSKVIPLLLGAGAAMVLLTALFFMSRGKTPPPKETHPTVVAQTTFIPPKGVNTDPHHPFIGVKTPDDFKSADSGPTRHPGFHKQLRELRDDLKNDKIKFVAAQHKLNEFVKEIEKVDKSGAIYAELRPAVFGLQKEIDIKQRAVTDEWKKLDLKVNGDIKDGHIGDALTKLSDFVASCEGSEEATKAAERIDALCSGVLSSADKIASGGNYKDARAQLTAITAKLPEKQDTLFKAAVASYDEQIRLCGELSDCYDRAWRKTLYFDPLAKTSFQFADGAKVCADGAAKIRDEAARKDYLDMAEYFKAAEKVFAELRSTVNAKTFELGSFSGMNGVTLRQWDDRGLTFTAREFPQQQYYNWDKPAAPDAVLFIAKEMKKADTDKAAAQWNLGLLAFAFGNRSLASKYLRESTSGEDSPYKTQAVVALKLTRPTEVPVVKPEKPEKPDPAPAVATSPSIEDDVRQAFKDLLDAKKADIKDKIKALRAEFESKYAATEFAKSHKKEIDDAFAAVVAAADPAKTPDPVKPPDKPKVVELPPDEKKAHELLKKMGWTDIIGTWVWDEEKQGIRVDGSGEVVHPALECDVSAQLRLLETTAKVRILTRVEKGTVADRFANFGGKTSLGFGADINNEHAFVYFDYKKGPSKDPISYFDVKLDPRASHNVDLSVHGNKMSLSVDGKDNKVAGGDARASGDTRIIVTGNVLFRLARISNTK